MQRLLTLAVLAAFAGPAVACINDSELPKYEREFRSQYTRHAPQAEPTASPPAYQYIMYGAGGALLTGAVAVTLRRRGG